MGLVSIIQASPFHWTGDDSSSYRSQFGITDMPIDDSGTTAYEALAKGLDDLMDACDVVTEKFTEARDEFDGVEDEE